MIPVIAARLVVIAGFFLFFQKNRNRRVTNFYIFATA
jgi:hypothetical protein